MTADRVLIVSHGHPDFSLGGGEIAAYSHWKALRRQGVDAMFLARVAMPGHVGTAFSSRSPDGRDLLFHVPPVDHFRHSQPHAETVYRDFRELLARFRPTAVHFHHYVHLGLELVREARRFAADMPIVLTLHDYLGPCNAQGQMLKTNGTLCTKATPLDCHGCFPERTPQDFFMRELYVKSFFKLVDHFVCPSRFLRDRYVAWGLPAERMTVLDNGLLPVTHAADVPTAGLQNRFVVLGQLSKLKGTPLLLDAIEALPKRVREDVRIEIHGSTQHTDSSVIEALQRAQKRFAPMLRYAGPYAPERVDTLVRRAGWVIVPSIWWENSPMVIQEAFRAGRPVICADIGGMAEKVRHRVDGLHFAAGSPFELARCIEEAATTPGLWQRLQAGVPAVPDVDDVVRQQLLLYRSNRPVAVDTKAAAKSATRRRAAPVSEARS